MIDLDAAAGRRRRRLPAPAPALAPARRAARGQTSTASSACCPTSSGRSPGPCAVDGFEATRAAAARAPAARSRCYGVDKFPRMVDYVVPDRRAHRRRRPGAARRPPGRAAPPSCTRASSTSTPARSARRWSRAASRPGVVVGDGSDIGGGASIMGTLSGGGTRGRLDRRALPARRQRRRRHLARRRLRRRGRPLRHRRHEGHRLGAGRADRRQGARAVRPRRLLFRRNSLTGAVEAVARAGTGIELNAALHAND